MSAADKRRKTTLWGALISDPYRKLAAIGLGIGLWYFLDSQVTQPHDITMPLRAVDPATRTLALEQDRSLALFVAVPTGLVTVRGFLNPATGRPIEQVTLHFEGPKHLIEDLKASTPTFTAGPFPSLRWEEIDSFPFDVDDVHLGDRSLRSLKMTMVPQQIEVLLEHNAQREIPLSWDRVEFHFHSQQDEASYGPRLLPQTASFSRDRITVRGPVSRLNTFLQRSKPFKVFLAAKQNEREATGPLTLNTDDQLLDLDPKPTVTVRLIPQQVEFTMEVPVLVDDLSLPTELRGRYHPSSPTMTVRLKVSGPVHSQLVKYDEWNQEQRRQWARDNLRLVVWIPPPEENGLLKNIVQEARLELLGPLSRVDPIHCTLAQTVSVNLEAR